MNLLYALIKGLWIIIPAYIANASALLSKGKKRMDFGKKFAGNELFGAGKTWKGLILAVGMGTLGGIVQIYLRPWLNLAALGEGFLLPELPLVAVFSIAVGAMLGDLLASFLKRRVGLKRGESAPLLDQLDFVTGGFAFALIFVDISPVAIGLVFAVTPVLHLLSNVVAHQIGAKEVPW